jgi:hypothetical protein
VTVEDVLTLRCLIEALGNIEQQLDKRGVEAQGTVFIRNDVYELLVENTSDRGKVTQVGLDWTDGDLLRELLRRRFVHTGVEGNPDFEELWRQICRTHVAGEESSQYLIERCLMRPRALIDLVGYCRSHAVNLGHKRIELETPIQLTGREILEATGRSVGEEKRDELFERLLWYGIFGIVRDNDQVTYIHDARYDMRRLLGLVSRRGKEDAVFRLNPAFWKALEAKV